ncbi:hypothetical protein [Dyella nitratireducens]|uniref:DUF1579 domain-containing protein n=1 Tax=Dyella nitratireducens TaxID=1849580 RepID=A0ABQ1G9N8_9GAMM|nr:hypothetical protein [Dyella nitratireducens]GGA39466.1 hypothetical protein GCM10010981_30860 [Dyella nitratireducens]GLQ40443.1 hypothetical protein GCM10007902_02920 [Dyella nitratireducens]
MHRIPMLATLITSALVSSAWCADTPTPPAELQALDITAGTWLYHGENLAVGNQKAGKWVWLEECGWSANKAFMACSFTMNNPDKVIKSHAVSTYNHSDKSYWHYEMFDSDGSGADPFIARMTIEGNTWAEYGKADNKTYRVTYHYLSPTKVTVRIELSVDDVHWTTLAQGEGIKQQ